MIAKQPPPAPAADGPGEPADEDPRRRRSRSRLLDAATNLLSSGGVEAVTVEAVTKASKVARTTLYRHFDNSAALVTAAFERLIPPVAAPPAQGTTRERLITLMDAIAESIEGAPLHLTVFGWLAIGPDRAAAGDTDADADTDAASLRERVVAQYREPFDALLDSPEVRKEIGDYDNTLAMLQLTGPMVFARLAALPPVDREQRARIVDDFLTARQAPATGAREGTRTLTS
ncbi:TetR/AcrR family transcriptional regulator [Tomitella fengzijianii]|uniref:Helix-turn-helix transcriptional regulator n=1 Tax=Tomitella fengzijianii TaxID=2597660 RepID=A0A516X512_9ACTN|nr:TetR/AcrR family transcriptional regulator [Tomitella fengzijianii]QDQ98103.1 helix-turn-helix transcriptional regulator [Tomitella fengzijianii]